ncbi:MAG: hypothetical protein ACNS62_25365 [Candidatus Cyclobacteriaceae bacterium M3_2C_046]
MGANTLQNFNIYGQVLALIFAGAAISILTYHLFKVKATSDLKKKYDYINLNEIKMLWYSSLAAIIAIGIFVNTLFTISGDMWFFVRLFTTIMMGLILGVIVSNVLKFYYPFYVEKRLKKLRYTPRVSPKNGKSMKLLSEDEEDVYLDEGMQAEENVFSVDYDVWIDEETGYTKIEKYAGHLHALQCPECNYQTLKVVKEEILESPTESEEGELMKFFKCDYCDYKERKAFRIARLRTVKPEETSNRPVTI